MITFDELVETTRIGLSVRKNSPKIVLPEVIRRVLQDAGLSDLMQRKASLESQRRLIVRQIMIHGHKSEVDSDLRTPFTYRRLLGSGINAWIAGNGTGKSTILKCIVWAVTGVEPNIKPDVKPWLATVNVEIEITGDAVYTIQYHLFQNAPGLIGDIFMSGLDDALTGPDVKSIQHFSGSKEMKEAISQFFEQRLGFTPLEWVKPKPFSTDLEHKEIGWNVYARAMFIGADSYADFLFPEHSLDGNHHQKAIGMYLGLDLLEAVAATQMARDRSRLDYSFEKKRMQVNEAQVRESIIQVSDELQQVERAVTQIEAGQSILVDTDYARQLNEKVAQFTKEFTDLSNTERKLVSERDQIQADIDQAERARQEMKEAIAFKIFLNGLQVDRCPRCENSISPMNVEDEIAIGQCHVCHSPLQPVSSIEAQQLLLEGIEAKIPELYRALRRVQREIKRVYTDRIEVQSTLSERQGEFDRLSLQAQEGFTLEMRRLIDRRGYLRGQLDQLQLQTQERQADRLEELKLRSEVLFVAMSQLELNVSHRFKDHLDELQRSTTELAKKFGIPHLARVILTPRFEMFVEQTGKTLPFAQLDASEALRLKVAFHLALLKLRAKERVGRHPTLLIVDAPAGAEIDDEHLAAMLAGFNAVRTELGDQVQILIASARDEFTAVCSPNQVAYKQAGEKLF